MANEKILSSLNKNVEKIQKNVSKFGPKLPGGDEPDTTPDDQLSVLCAIAGTVFGKKFNGVEDILNKNPKDSLLSKVLYNITEIFDNKYFKKIEEIFKNNINQSLTNNLGNILKESFVSDEFKNTLLEILNNSNKEYNGSQTIEFTPSIDFNPIIIKLDELISVQNKNNFNQIIKSLTNNLRNILKESFISNEFKNTLLEILNDSNKEYNGSQTIEFTPNIDFNPIITKLDELISVQTPNDFNPIITKLDELISVQTPNDFNKIIKSLTNNLSNVLKESFVSNEFKNTLLEILNTSNKEHNGSQTIEFTPSIDFNPIITKLDELFGSQNENNFNPIITKLDELISVQNENDFSQIIKPLTNNLSNVLKESFVSNEFKNTLSEILNTSNKEYNASQTIILETDTNLVSLIDELTELLESQKLTDGDKVTESFKFINNLLNSLDEIKNSVNIDELTNFIYEINKIPGIDSSIKPRLKELSNILVNSDKNKDIKSIKEIYTDIKNINTLLKGIDITKSINQIVNNLKNINKLDTVEIDQKSIIDNLKNINKIFDKNDNKNNINIVSLLSKIKETFTYTEKDKSIFTGVKSFLSIIDTLAKIGEKKINIQYLITNINVLNNLLDVNKGDVAKLITNIQELSRLIAKNKTTNNVLLIDTIIDLLLKVISINPVKLLFAKLGLKALNNIIENDLNQVLITLNEVAISSEKSKKESIVMLGSFIDSLLKLADIGLMQMFRIQLNFTILSKFIVRGFSEIIESLNEVSADIEKSEKTISNVKNFIDVLLHSLNIDDDKQSRIFDSLDFLNSIIDEIKDFYSHLLEVNPVQTDVLGNINNTFMSFNILLQSIPGYKELTISLLKVDLINDISKTLDEIIKNINGIKLKDIQDATKNVEELSKLFDKLNNVGQRIDSFNFDAKNLKNLIKVLIDAKEKEPLIFAGIEILTQVAKKLKVIVESINDIPTIKEEVVKNLSTLISDFTKVVVICGGLLLFAGIVMALVDTNNIFLFGITLTILVTAVTGTILHFAKDIKESNIVLKDLALLILSAGFTLVLGSYMYHYLNLGDLLGFVAILGAFIWGMTYAIIKTTKNVPTALEGIKDFGIFIAICGATLIYGSLLFHLIKMQDLAGFALVLGAFVFMSLTGLFGSIGLAGNIFGLGDNPIEILKNSMKGILDFGIFIAICGTTLIFGSLLFNLIKMQDLAGFAFILGLFIFASLTALFGSIALAGKIFGLGEGDPMDILKNSMRGIIDFGIFIAICGATLALGSAIYHFVDSKALVGFTVILGLFVFGMIAIATIASRFMKKSFKSIQDFGKLIAISGIILLFGGTFFTLFPGVKKGVFEFAVTLGLFMLMIGGALALTGQGLKKNKHIALEFALLVAICGGILLFAGYVLKDETISKNIWTFIGMTFVLVGGMAAIIWVLSKFKKQNLIQGGLALIGIVAIVGLMAIVLDKIVETTNKIQDIDKLHQGLLACAMAFGGMTVIVAIISGIMAIPGIKMIAGVGLAMVLGIAAAMLIVSESMLNVAKALDQLSKIKQFDGRVLLGNLSALMGIVTALAPFTLIAPTIKYTSNALMSLTKLMSEMAKAVKDYSSLKIPEYSGTKLIGYRKLESSDFVKAGNNIKLIITTLGDAVIQTYEKKPEMFETNLFGNSKFAKVTKSLKTLAPLISSIAKSVKDYADLKIVESWTKDKDGRLIPDKYSHLKKSDFEKAADHIGIIITKLGDAIIQTYDKKPEMFETNFFGNSKFGKVTKSLKTLAPLISSIAKSVKDYADLKIADYGEGDLEYDQNGRPKIKKYKQLTKTDFEDAARHIGIIINTLGEGIIQCYHENPDIYDEGTFTSGIFGKVVKSNMRLGDLISKISKSVQDFANLHMPTGYTVDKDGNMKPTGFRTMTPTDFENAASNIQKIITILGTPILRVTQDKNLFPLFEETSGFFESSKSPVSLIIEGNLKLASLVTKIGKAVQSIAQLKLPIYENGKLVGYELLVKKDITQIGTIIQNIIEALPKAVIDGYKKFPEELKIKDGEENKLLNNIKFSFESISSIIKNIASGISSYSSMKIADWSQGVDEHGNPKVYLTLEESTIKTAGENVKHMLTYLGGAIEEVSKKKWFDKDYQNKLDSMNQTFDKINQLISQSAKTIQDVSNLRIVESFDNNGNALGYLRMKKENFEEAARNAVIVVTSVMKALYNIYQGKDEEGKPLLEGLTPESIQAMFDNENGKDSPFQKVINTSINLAGMISSVAEGVELFTKMDTTKLKEVAGPIGQILGAISDAVIKTVRDPKNLEAFGAPDILLGLTKGDANKAPAMIAVNAIAGMVEPIGKLATIIGYYSANQFPIVVGHNSKGDPVYTFKTLRPNIAKNNIKLALEAMVGALVSITKTDDFNTMMRSYQLDNFISRFNDYIASLSSLIEINDKAKNSGVDGYNNIIKGIAKINNSVNGIKPDKSKNFKNFNNELDHFITTINKVNVDKVDKVTKFVKSMESLANKFGSLDKLVDAIAESLATELNRLSNEITNSKEVINKAETIQKNREKIIEKQINNVKTILSQSLKIEIGQIKDDNPLSKSDKQSSSGGGGSKPKETKPETKLSNTTGSKSSNNMISQNNTDNKQNNSYTPFSSSPISDNSGSSEQDIMTIFEEVLQRTQWKIDGSTIKHK